MIVEKHACDYASLIVPTALECVKKVKIELDDKLCEQYSCHMRDGRSLSSSIEELMVLYMYQQARPGYGYDIDKLTQCFTANKWRSKIRYNLSYVEFKNNFYLFSVAGYRKMADEKGMPYADEQLVYFVNTLKQSYSEENIYRYNAQDFIVDLRTEEPSSFISFDKKNDLSIKSCIIKAFLPKKLGGRELYYSKILYYIEKGFYYADMPPPCFLLTVDS